MPCVYTHSVDSFLSTHSPIFVILSAICRPFVSCRSPPPPLFSFLRLLHCSLFSHFHFAVSVGFVNRCGMLQSCRVQLDIIIYIQEAISSSQNKLQRYINRIYIHTVGLL